VGNRSKQWTTESGILDLVHTDVCGLMSVESVSESNYFTIFIDDFSRRTSIFFMRTKSEIFSQFQEFKALMENQIGKKIRVLRSYNGGEYTSNNFNDFCREAGIKRELTVPYNPHQNEVAERKNRSIIGVAKAMIRDKDLSMFLWAKACNTTMYVQNKSPHKVLEDKTSKEVFIGVKSEIGHFRIFSCPVYIHVLAKKRTKLDPSREKGLFIGYSETSKAYRIWIPVQRKIVVR
jgi:transposase InsO family protein